LLQTHRDTRVPKAASGNKHVAHLPEAFGYLSNHQVLIDREGSHDAMACFGKWSILWLAARCCSFVFLSLLVLVQLATTREDLDDVSVLFPRQYHRKQKLPLYVRNHGGPLACHAGCFQWPGGGPPQVILRTVQKVIQVAFHGPLVHRRHVPGRKSVPDAIFAVSPRESVRKQF
jgi:hypothetical protein